MENIRIQDDLYLYVNGETLDRLVIPDDKPVAGGFSELADGVEKIMMDEFETMSASKSYPNDFLKRACELYMIAKDADRKAQLGISPALNRLAILKRVLGNHFYLGRHLKARKKLTALERSLAYRLYLRFTLAVQEYIYRSQGIAIIKRVFPYVLISSGYSNALYRVLRLKSVVGNTDYVSIVYSRGKSNARYIYRIRLVLNYLLLTRFINGVLKSALA